jgi:hypothetical protein
MLDEVCTKNSAYAALTASEGHHERKLITRLQITATPVSDRGVVCRLTGMMIAQQGQVGSMTFTKEPLQATIIVAVTGDAELVSEDFASALLNSPSIAAMASNVGNDGEVVPKYNVY